MMTGDAGTNPLFYSNIVLAYLLCQIRLHPETSAVFFYWEITAFSPLPKI